jgi:hypothetical protein
MTSNLLVVAITFPIIAQASSGSYGDATSILESAKMHLISTMTGLKLGSSQAALTCS